MSQLRQVAAASGVLGSPAFVARVSRDPHRPLPLRTDEVLVLDALPPAGVDMRGFRALLLRDVSRRDAARLWAEDTPVVQLPSGHEQLSAGDVIGVEPARGRVRVLYRVNSRHNSLFLTERCNNNCVMCSQPPKAKDDYLMVRECCDVIRLISTETPQLAVTGGEPTMLGAEFVRLLAFCKNWLPSTALLVLSNARLFKFLTFAEAVADVEHPDLTIGVPLYSDLAGDHEFIVQAEHAFDETIRGLLNLARCEQRIELRVVVNRYNVDRLPSLARFIGRNLPFVQRVALMGLELMGHARANLDLVWTDPADYAPALAYAVSELARHGLRPLIFNHQLCTLPRELWAFSVKSISDHKNVYFPECERCAVRSQCGGFFSSSLVRRSRAISPVN